MTDYKLKYLKYKRKYLELKGGAGVWNKVKNIFTPSTPSTPTPQSDEEFISVVHADISIIIQKLTEIDNWITVNDELITKINLPEINTPIVTQYKMHISYIRQILTQLRQYTDRINKISDTVQRKKEVKTLIDNAITKQKTVENAIYDKKFNKLRDFLDKTARGIQKRSVGNYIPPIRHHQ
jgi:hypothetical protein